MVSQAHICSPEDTAARSFCLRQTAEAIRCDALLHSQAFCIKAMSYCKVQTWFNLILAGALNATTFAPLHFQTEG